ncbi:b39.1 [miniopterid betaherpesvirus 1]|uniref:B39.1 n=1 Tax=miniopterid betaherpesvirus 1 TaxID=3070189 RepID=I3VQ16_9BETA|nr:b39.1 [miniopterid betaherpesvirus 1]AFK83860.1 b39.1 [miniopterid betaherpesvirus 1]
MYIVCFFIVLGVSTGRLTMRSVTVGHREASVVTLNRSSDVNINGVPMYALQIFPGSLRNGLRDEVGIASDVGRLGSAELLSYFVKFSLKDLWSHVRAIDTGVTVDVTTERVCDEANGERFANYTVFMSGEVCFFAETVLSAGVTVPVIHTCATACCVRNVIRNAVENIAFCARQVFDMVRPPDVAVYRFEENATHDGLVCVASDYAPDKISMTWYTENVSVGDIKIHVLRSDSHVESAIELRVPRGETIDHVCQVTHPALGVPVNASGNRSVTLTSAPCILQFIGSCPVTSQAVFVGTSFCLALLMLCGCVFQIVTNYTRCAGSVSSRTCCVFDRRMSEDDGATLVTSCEDQIADGPYRWSEMTVTIDE